MSSKSNKNQPMEAEFLKKVKSGNDDEIKKLIEQAEPEANILYRTTRHGNTALHMAARFGRVVLVEEIIRRLPSLVLKSNLKGETPVHIAARAGYDAIVYQFFKSVRGFDSVHIARIKDRFGNTPLHFAVQNKHYKVVKAFADKDTDSLVSLNDDGESPLSIAIDLKQKNLVAKIIELNAHTLDYRGHNRQTLLHRAVIRHEHDTMLIILNKEPQLTSTEDDRARTPLHYAASLGEIKMVKMLLSVDISPAYVQDVDKKIPLHLAAENGQPNVLKALIESCPDTVEFIDKRQQNILHLAAKNGNLKAVQYILELDEMEDLVNSPDVDGNTPLHLAAVNYHIDVLRKLLSDDSKVDIKAVNNSNRTALAVAQVSDEHGRELQKYITLKVLKNSYNRRAIDLADVSDNNAKESYEEVFNATKSRQVAQTISVMASLIATFTFTAAFTLPGGLKNDSPDIGTALVITRAAFQAFVIADSIAMTTSIMVAVILLWSSSRRDNESFMGNFILAIFLFWISLLAMTAAFVTGLYVVLRKTLWLATVVCVISCAAPLFLYVWSPLIRQRNNRVEDNPVRFIILSLTIRFRSRNILRFPLWLLGL